MKLATWGDYSPSKSHKLADKIPVLDMGNLLSSCWSEESKRLSKQGRPLLLPLVASQNLKNLLLKTLDISDTGL